MQIWLLFGEEKVFYHSSVCGRRMKLEAVKAFSHKNTQLLIKKLDILYFFYYLNLQCGVEEELVQGNWKAVLGLLSPYY